MNKKPCEFCGKPTPQVEGRRAKKFCSDSCRQKNWQANNKPGPSSETKISPPSDAEIKAAAAEKSRRENEKKPPTEDKNTKTEEVKDRKVLHSTTEKTREILEPKEGTNAYYLRYGAFYKKDIKK